MKSFEVNFDGLVGPTHNYGGLSFGNVASQSNSQQASNPKEAALMLSRASPLPQRDGARRYDKRTPGVSAAGNASVGVSRDATGYAQ